MADLGALIEHCLNKFMPISQLKNIKRFPNWKGPAFGDLGYLRASLESVGPDRCIIAMVLTKYTILFPWSCLSIFYISWKNLDVSR
jgi:hypothetical protein